MKSLVDQLLRRLDMSSIYNYYVFGRKCNLKTDEEHEYGIREQHVDSTCCKRKMEALCQTLGAL